MNDEELKRQAVLKEMLLLLDKRPFRIEIRAVPARREVNSFNDHEESVEERFTLSSIQYFNEEGEELLYTAFPNLDIKKYTKLLSFELKVSCNFHSYLAEDLL